jgi:transposase
LHRALPSSREHRRFVIAVLSECEEQDSVIATAADVSIPTVKRWQNRQENGLDIWDTPRPGRPCLYDKDIEDRFIAFYCQSTPLSKHGRWSLRWAEAELTRITDSSQPKQASVSPLPRDVVGVCLKRSTMQRILSRHNLRPHRNAYFMHISDPDFFPKMAHIIALYKTPPKHLYCFDECPGIQILQRITPDMRPSDETGLREWWKEFEYIRNGTTDLFAFLNVRNGKLDLSCHPDHTKNTFMARFKAHCLHDQYAGPEQLHRVIMEYQDYWNDFLAHPFNWQYDGSGLHQKAVKRFIILLTSPDTMRLQFLTKSCKLMLNLLREYPDRIENQYWQQLANVVITQQTQLQRLIDASKQPIVKVNAANSLTVLVQAITAFATAEFAA